jgi:hypothetical protein
MSWHYLRELEGESLEDICSGGEPLQPLKSKTTHAEFYCNGKLMDSYLDSLSGTISAPLTEYLGEAKSMSSQGDFLAKTSALQEKVQDSMESVQDSGGKWRASLAKFDPVLSLWKTAQCSLFEDLEQSLVTFPNWGSMLNGELSELTPLVSSTGETESGLLPTVTAQLFDYFNVATLKIEKDGVRKSGVKVGSTFWWHMTEQHLRLGGPKDYKLKPDPSCGEILMGFPLCWTELKPLETHRFQLWLHLHGKS